MCLLHKYRTVAESPKWEALRCEKCGKVKWIEKFQGGYQPKPLLPWEPNAEHEPPKGNGSRACGLYIEGESGYEIATPYGAIKVLLYSIKRARKECGKTSHTRSLLRPRRTRCKKRLGSGWSESGG